MLLARFDPFTRDLPRLTRRSLDLTDGWFVPNLDIAETDAGYVVRAELPGLDRDDIDVEVKNDVLRISGERSNETEETSEQDANVKWIRRESSYGRFERRVSLRTGTDPDSVKASFDNGVLEVSVAKPAVEQPKKIEIES